MFSNIVASSEDLARMTRVLDAFCLEKGIPSDGRPAVGRSLVELFGRGASTEAALRAGLDTLPRT